MQKIIEELAAQVDASLAGVTSSESLAAFWQEYQIGRASCRERV